MRPAFTKPGYDGGQRNSPATMSFVVKTIRSQGSTGISDASVRRDMIARRGFDLTVRRVGQTCPWRVTKRRRAGLPAGRLEARSVCLLRNQAANARLTARRAPRLRARCTALA